jgi:hypothetical protein
MLKSANEAEQAAGRCPKANYNSLSLGPIIGEGVGRRYGEFPLHDTTTRFRSSNIRRGEIDLNGARYRYDVFFQTL